MYADDLVVYCKANRQEAQAVADCMLMYCEWTGHEVNWHKSTVHFSRNTIRQLRRELSEILHMQECRHNVSYLGHPFYKFKHKTKAYKGVMESLVNKLARWKQNFYLWQEG